MFSLINLFFFLTRHINLNVLIGLWTEKKLDPHWAKSNSNKQKQSKKQISNCTDHFYFKP